MRCQSKKYYLSRKILELKKKPRNQSEPASDCLEAEQSVIILSYVTDTAIKRD